MIPTLTEQQYLNNIRESRSLPKNLLLDFSGSGYSGNETIGELLLVEAGVEFDSQLLEGILSMPINTIKALTSKLVSNSGSIEGMKKSKAMLEPVASKTKPETVQKYAISLASTKGIEAVDVKKAHIKFLRLFSGASSIATTIVTPIGWLVILIALIKSGSPSAFRKELSDALDEMDKGMRGINSEFEQSLALGSYALKLLLLSMVPPWIQAIAFLPMAAIYAIVSYFIFIVEFLGQFGK